MAFSFPADRNTTLKMGLLMATLLAAVLMYADTVHSLISIWNSSETFTHQYAILPIALWLIWQRRRTLAPLSQQPYWPALLLLAGCGALWLAGRLADVQVVRQYAFVLMLILVAVTMLGRQIASAIAFPLLFLLFAVPFGEVFIGPLIEFTADFTIAALRLSGIPVLREGNSFAIPTGQWSVVEACSGVRYLIASLTLGCLYAYLTYRSRVRQLIFVLISIIVPIFANGVRAYMIVMIGHLSGMELAVGVDHLIYGWIFFGVVMFLMFWLGSFWQESTPEPDAPDSPAPASGVPASVPARPRASVRAAAAVIVCLAVWPLAAQKMEQAQLRAHRADLSRLDAAWDEARAFSGWKPAFTAPDAELRRFYAPANGAAPTVGLAINYYRNQRPGSTLISSVNRILPEKEANWNRISTAVRNENVQGHTIAVREDVIQSAAMSLLIWRWYAIDGRKIENDYLGKIAQARQKLMLRGDDGAAVFVYTPLADKPDAARQQLRAFLEANLPAIDAALARNRLP